MKRATFLKLWPLKYKKDEWTVVRMSLKPGRLAPGKPAGGFTNADFAQHVIALKPRVPQTFTVVRHISRIRSTARIIPIPSSGSPTALSTIAIVTRPALGIPAAPIAANVAVKKINTCWPNDRSMPYTWAINTAATDS